MKLELNDHEPIFIQISKAIEDEILCDSIKEGMQVPSTTELSKFYKINHKIKQYQAEKQELLEALELYYRIKILGEKVDFD